MDEETPLLNSRHEEVLSLDEKGKESTVTQRSDESSDVASSNKFRLRIGYACGHAQNDLCAAMYFSYLLVYLEGAGLSPVHAGIVLITGQFVDGMATPLVGSLSDRLNCFKPGCCFGLSGRRKAWYIAGMFLVTCTFWVLFTPYPRTTSLTLIPPVVYYSAANCLFQIGWASVQVSHMAMVPELTSILSERTLLNSVRFLVTVGTDITVYTLVWAFSEADGNVASDVEARRGIQQEITECMLMQKLQIISYIILILGALLGIVFIFLVKEKEILPASAGPYQGKKRARVPRRLSRKSSGIRSSITADFIWLDELEPELPKTIGGWLQTPGFLGVAANYSMTRLCVNAIQIYLPFFVIFAYPSYRAAVATAPLTACIGMCASSALAPKMGTLVTDAAQLYANATSLVLLGALVLFLASAESSLIWVFVASGILGIGSAQLMVTSQTQVCELVGCNPNGGVVFGFNSLLDKVSTGVVIYIIQRFVQEVDETRLKGLYKLTVAGVPLCCALLGALSLLSVPKRIRDRNGCVRQKEADKRASLVESFDDPLEG
mmetsp:Transcript_56691/g.169358  ORF Transcript_56691/g.169358 Transcript_56691/m.169358 type:complete len:549 (-) Transcript_56691:189-1835(-)